MDKLLNNFITRHITRARTLRICCYLSLLFLVINGCSIDRQLVNDSHGTVIPQAFVLTKENRRIVLIGTFHSNNQEVIDVAKRLTPEVVNAEALFVEVDKRELKNANLSEFYYKKGGRLSRALTPSSYAHYKEKLAGKVPSSIERLRPMTVYILSVTPDESLSKNGVVMDDYLTKMAIKKGVKTMGLETFEEQFTSLYALNEAATIQMLELQATNQNDIEEASDFMQNAYVAGDLLTVFHFSTVMPEGLSENNAKAVKAYLTQLIEGRNIILWQRAQQRVEQDNLTNVVIAVGAAHLLGDNGIVNLATQAGYSVDKYTVPRLDKSAAKQ